MTAGPDEVGGSGLNQMVAVGWPLGCSRGVPIPGSTGWHQVTFTLANLWTTSSGRFNPVAPFQAAGEGAR
jgi:hypothetical protein